MPITETPLKHWIDHFYGYGSWEAKIWFVAYEEGGGDLPEEVAAKLEYFEKMHGPAREATLCDIREMYRWVPSARSGSGELGPVPSASSGSGGSAGSGSGDSLYDYRFGQQAVKHGVWKNLIAFRHGYKNQELPDVLEYQKKMFVSSSAPNEALIRLYPLPSPHNHAWYYSWLDLPQFPFLKSRALYQEHVYQNRIDSILHNLRANKPDVVLMYGMNNINMLKKSVQEVFASVKFKMVKATKMQIPQHHRVDLDGTTLVITTQIPALRHNRIETGFDWREFGKIAALE